MKEVMNLLEKYFKEGELEEILEKKTVEEIVRNYVLRKDQRLLRNKNIIIQKYLCTSCEIERYIWYEGKISDEEVKELLLKDHNKYSKGCTNSVCNFILYDKREMKL